RNVGRLEAAAPVVVPADLAGGAVLRLGVLVPGEEVITLGDGDLCGDPDAGEDDVNAGSGGILVRGLELNPAPGVVGDLLGGPIGAELLVPLRPMLDLLGSDPACHQFCSTPRYFAIEGRTVVGILPLTRPPPRP